MSPNKLRAVHALATKYQLESGFGGDTPDLTKVPYETLTTFPDLINHLKGLFGASRLPDEKMWNRSLRTYEEHEALGIHMIPISDPDYPKYLSRIDNPPQVLFLRGNRSILRDLPGVSIVGTREVTENGATITKRITEHLVSHGWTVVSGLARGIDAIAHKSCLDAGGKTIAVLANGLDAPQPKQNAELGYRILDNDGAWVSEQPVGTKVERYFFVQRNRIQLGLSAGSVIVEAALKSGTMTQAAYCVQQNRPLFAVVPETKENNLRLLCEGTNTMVAKMGGIPLRTKNDYPQMVALLSEQRSMMHSL